MTATTMLEDSERRKAWGFVAPALGWTLAFFILPFLYMTAMSLWSRQGREIVRVWNLDNYARFFSESALLRGLTNSLEITLTVTVLSVLLAYPLAWIIAERVPKRWQRMALILEIAAALGEDRAEAIVLGCAGMADLAATLRQEFGVPVVDGVAAAVKQAEALVGLGLSTAKRGPYATPVAKTYRGALESFAPQAMLTR